MRNLVIAAIVALSAFAVNAAGPEKAAGAAAPAAPQATQKLSPEQCEQAMAECKNDDACKQKLRSESNCK